MLNQEALREQQDMLRDSLQRSVERQQNTLMQHQVMVVQSSGPVCSIFKHRVTALNSEFGVSSVDTSGARPSIRLDPEMLRT